MHVYDSLALRVHNHSGTVHRLYPLTRCCCTLPVLQLWPYRRRGCGQLSPPTLPTPLAWCLPCVSPVTKLFLLPCKGNYKCKRIYNANKPLVAVVVAVTALPLPPPLARAGTRVRQRAHHRPHRRRRRHQWLGPSCHRHLGVCRRQWWPQMCSRSL